MPHLHKFFKLSTLFTILALCQAEPGFTREYWQMQQPAGPPPTGPITPTGTGRQIQQGMVPQVAPNFWQQQAANSMVPSGTIFSTVLQQQISSQSSKIGDSFQLLLKDGYSQNGALLIPPGSMIAGAVHTCIPATALRNGQPGRIDVSLINLVFPDGRSIPISAFIDHNPAHDPQDPDKSDQTHYTGASFKHYGGMFTSFLGSFTRGIGKVNMSADRGVDFALKKDTVVIVRLTGPLAIPAYNSKTWSNQAAQSDNARPSVPGLAVADPEAPVTVPAVDAFHAAVPAGMAATAGKLGAPLESSDPNAIFNKPLQAVPRGEVADPF